MKSKKYTPISYIPNIMSKFRAFFYSIVNKLICEFSFKMGIFLFFCWIGKIAISYSILSYSIHPRVYPVYYPNAWHSVRKEYRVDIRSKSLEFITSPSPAVRGRLVESWLSLDVIRPCMYLCSRLLDRISTLYSFRTECHALG